ncbi:uncharacterized protein LOC124697322 [Lolium rigidum]|uniref:uncharacterized protein LOC124697322 n=1 Tax=Lolium rigidum TaxID=89674 RepID=UPI001F5DCCB2|nr:uncharacterized protein LOC124697322 [Lolium rigidum]
MLLVSQAANGSLSARRLPSKPPASHRGANPYPLFANPRIARRRLALSGADAPRRASAQPRAAAGEGPSGSAAAEDPVLVGVNDDRVPLEGVIQVEKPGGADAQAKLVSYAKVGLLAGGDLLCLLVFSAIGRLSHGLPALDAETFKTADPFIAGWLLSAYFLGGFGDEAKGSNGVGNAVTVAAKSWAVGIPLGIAIRSLASGHIPQTPFILVAMGSTGVLLTAWRALASQVLSTGQQKKDDVYKKGNPFELFEVRISFNNYHSTGDFMQIFA